MHATNGLNVLELPVFPYLYISQLIDMFKAIVYTLFISLFARGFCANAMTAPFLTVVQKADKSIVYQSEQLVIQRLSEHTFVHISYLQTETFGNVPCNGMIVIANGEASIYDTPTNDQASEELIEFLEKKMNCHVTAVVATHFHNDCVGGLNSFHQHGIPSYASERTLNLIKRDSSAIAPNHSFEDHFDVATGGLTVHISYFGEGHTTDNVVAYLSEDRVLFGGCLVKELGAGKGYLGDANTAEWSETVGKIAAHYPDLRIVIPGHGAVGGKKLLRYTIQLFEER